MRTKFKNAAAHRSTKQRDDTDKNLRCASTWLGLSHKLSNEHPLIRRYKGPFARRRHVRRGQARDTRGMLLDYNDAAGIIFYGLSLLSITSFRRYDDRLNASSKRPAMPDDAPCPQRRRYRSRYRGACRPLPPTGPCPDLAEAVANAALAIADQDKVRFERAHDSRRTTRCDVMTAPFRL